MISAMAGQTRFETASLKTGSATTGAATSQNCPAVKRLPLTRLSVPASAIHNGRQAIQRGHAQNKRHIFPRGFILPGCAAVCAQKMDQTNPGIRARVTQELHQRGAGIPGSGFQKGLLKACSIAAGSAKAMALAFSFTAWAPGYSPASNPQGTYSGSLRSSSA